LKGDAGRHTEGTIRGAPRRSCGLAAQQRWRRTRITLLCTAFVVAAPAALAVLLGVGDGLGNTTPPENDPGWDRVGSPADCPPQCDYSYVYLGKGWVLSYSKARITSLRLGTGEKIYEPGSAKGVRLGSRTNPVDLRLFQLVDPPDLPLLKISLKSPRQGDDVVMIGRGMSRGGPKVDRQMRGWGATPPAVLRWGTNRVSNERIFKRNHLFALRFNRANSFQKTEFEAHAVKGDLGGPVFVEREEEWELAGVMSSATPSFLGGGLTYVIDLARYREQLLKIIDPDP
jgi:hypothetical protein